MLETNPGVAEPIAILDEAVSRKDLSSAAEPPANPWKLAPALRPDWIIPAQEEHDPRIGREFPDSFGNEMTSNAVANAMDIGLERDSRRLTP